MTHNFPLRAGSITDLTTRIKRDMLNGENIALGTDGPAGSRDINRRADFYNKAHGLGYCTIDEIEQLQKFYQAGWWEDLSR